MEVDLFHLIIHEMCVRVQHKMSREASGRRRGIATSRVVHAKAIRARKSIKAPGNEAALRHFRWTYLILMVKKCVRLKTRNKNTIIDVSFTLRYQRKVECKIECEDHCK